MTYPVFDTTKADATKQSVHRPIGKASDAENALFTINASIALADAPPDSPDAKSVELDEKWGVTGWFVGEWSDDS